MKNPLLGNHVAKHLKKFFKEKGIKYDLNHWTIIPDDHNSKGFPPLVFVFKPDTDSILVYNKLNLSRSLLIPCSTVTVLFEKLIRFRFLNENHL